MKMYHFLKTALSLLVEILSPKRHVGVLVFKSVAVLSDGYNFALVVLALDFHTVSHQSSHLYKPVPNKCNC